MSEEEIIEILKGYSAKDKKCLSCAVPNREICVLNGSDCIDEAIQGLLDLYNKEKEKNKELENKIKEIIDKIDAEDYYCLNEAEDDLRKLVE